MSAARQIEAEAGPARDGARAYWFDDDGLIPNNVLPLVILVGAIEPARQDPAVSFERAFTRNGWTNTWRNGIFRYHHYHANTHEVLGIASGSALVRFGGEEGATIETNSGDVIVIPAGLGHKLIETQGDLLVVGAYPDGREPDMMREDALGIRAARRRIAQVHLPERDPVDGRDGALFRFWR